MCIRNRGQGRAATTLQVPDRHLSSREEQAMKEYLKRAVLLAAAHWGEIEMQEVSAGWKDTKDVYFAVESCNVKLHCTFNVPHIVRLIPILFAGSLALFARLWRWHCRFGANGFSAWQCGAGCDSA